MRREKLLVHRDGKKFIYIAIFGAALFASFFVVCIKSRSDCRVNNVACRNSKCDIGKLHK